MTLLGQAQVTYGYDNADRMTSISQGSASTTSTYDDAGRQLTTTLPNGVVGTYAFDDASRITSISYAVGQTSLGALTYSYDPAGRRVTAGGALARVALPAAVSTTTYNANNELTKWNSTQTQPTYDANGNMLTDGTYSYVWNARNQLVQLKSGATVVASFAYDALGRRVNKTVSGATTGYAYGGGNFVQEKDGTGTPTANLLTGGLDRLFGRTDASGPRYPLIDAVGSTVALSDSAGAVQTSYTYEPFGKTTASGASSSNSQQYTGRENDGSLYFYRARYLHPVFGRFAAEDPAGFAGSGTNLYAYVRGDPIGSIDPTGEFGIFAAFGLGCALGVVGFIVGTAFSNDMSHKCENLILGGLGACVAGGISMVVKGDIFTKAFTGAATATIGNAWNQWLNGPPPDPTSPINVKGATSFIIAGVTGALTGATPVGSVAQGLVVAGVSGALEPTVNKFIDDVIRSVRLR